MMVIVFV